MRPRITVPCLLALLLAVVCPGACPGTTAQVRDAGFPSFDLSIQENRQNVVFWFDDMESGGDWWSHGDATAVAVPRFHVDAYLSHPEGGHSYWCGVLDPGYSGGDGYGNAWDQRLRLPAVYIEGSSAERTSWGAVKARFRAEAAGDRSAVEEDDPRQRSAIPILTFDYRCDSEPGYDFTWVQAESAGAWFSLDGGYTGSSGGWQQETGFDLSGFGDPVNVRFRFMSDGAGSDEDGLYDSDGGAFHVDNISVYDFTSGAVYFHDDCEDGVGLCHGTVPPAAGDWWHLIDRSCPALSDPHSWWCGGDSDTSLIPPALHNWLRTPLIDVGWAHSCTAHFAIHFAMPENNGDYVEFRGTVDGEDYYSFGSYWGDFGACSGWSGRCYNIGFGLGQLEPIPLTGPFGFEFIFHTDDNGCGPAAAGDAGVMIDDFWFEGYIPY
jgi:hypothetical protein